MALSGFLGRKGGNAYTDAAAVGDSTRTKILLNDISGVARDDQIMAMLVSQLSCALKKFRKDSRREKEIRLKKREIRIKFIHQISLRTTHMKDKGP
ncbi:hypothetical protein V6N13_125595 [Hibiscus sabdariffa]